MPEAIPPQIDALRRRARRRLVGAVVLALAAAVLVPMLLESDPKPLGEDVSVKIPPIDDGKFVNKVGEKARAAEAPAKSASPPPVVAKESWREPAKEPPAPQQAATPPKAPSEAPKAAPVEAPPGATPKPAAAETAKSTGNSAAPPPGGAFNVQLAAFSDDKGANALANRLKGAGHAAYVEPYKSSRGTLWRVRIGPFPTLAAAQAAQAKLKAEGHDGIIPPAN